MTDIYRDYILNREFSSIVKDTVKVYDTNLPEAAKDFKSLDGNQRIMVAKAIDNPLPIQEGGYGKPLGIKHGNDLSGLLKIKLRGAGLRAVYKLIRTESEMLVIVIGVRAQ